MQETKQAEEKAAAAAESHPAEVSADEVAQRLGSLGDESDATGAEAAAEEAGAEEAESQEQAGADGEQTEGEAAEEAAESEEEKPDARIPIDRLNREIAKTREQRERAEALEQEMSALKSKLDDQAVAVAANLAVHPDYVPGEDRKLIERANALEQEMVDLAEKWDGVEDDDPKKAMTAQQARRRHAQVQAELLRIGPSADAAYGRARKQMLDDMQLGKKIRLEREAAARAKPPAKSKEPAKVGAPARPAAPNARPIGAPGMRKPDPLKSFRDAGGEKGGDDALAAALSQL